MLPGHRPCESDLTLFALLAFNFSTSQLFTLNFSLQPFNWSSI